MSAEPDPREFRDASDTRPVVGITRRSNLGLYAFIVSLLVGGLLLFNALSANREATQTPDTIVPVGDPVGRIVSPPPLALPDLVPDTRMLPQRPEPRTVARATSMEQPIAPPRIVYRPAPATASQSAAPLPRDFDLPGRSYPFERNFPDASSAAPQAEAVTADRITATRLANPSLTVPKGTVIPAVLETAIDSTRPGAVRALVQREVKGFDGSRVLIQRGSRLYGEYDGGVDRGQKRALIRWTRLIRPDGVTIALDSPASDPLGRAGVKGKVDGKFFARFGNALVQTVLDIGVGVATREAGGGVVVALPGSTQNVARQSSDADIQPTLRVRHGTSVSVFVAHDLDFSTVER